MAFQTVFIKQFSMVSSPIMTPSTCRYIRDFLQIAESLLEGRGFAVARNHDNTDSQTITTAITALCLLKNCCSETVRALNIERNLQKSSPL